MNNIFICPKCNKKIVNDKCINCNYEIPIINGIYNFSKETSDRYISYEDINIHFEPTLIYWGNHFGIYGAIGFDIVNRLGKDIVALDLGCGLGTATIPLAKAGVKTIGVDVSMAMLQYAYNRCEEMLSILYFCKMNAYNLMLEDNSIDIIIENAMIHLVDNPEKVYQEIYRVLKPNGIFIHYSSENSNHDLDLINKSKLTYDAYKDISNYYHSILKELGYEPFSFDNNAFELEKQYFQETERIVCDYEEEFREDSYSLESSQVVDKVNDLFLFNKEIDINGNRGFTIYFEKSKAQILKDKSQLEFVCLIN